MKPSLKSSFIAYELEEKEQLAAYNFTSLQLAGIQNLLAAAAEEIINPPLDMDDESLPAIKKRAYLQGQVAILKHLLEMHEAFSQLPTDSQEG